MKGNWLKLLIGSVAIPILAFLLALLINILTNNDVFNDLKEKGWFPWLVGIVIIVFVPTIIYTIYQFRNQQNEVTDNQFSENIETDIKKFYESIKERYQKRYESKLDGRFEIALEVSEDFDNLNLLSITEQFNIDANKGEAIRIISEAFRKEGRLLIAGNPGVGKTVLLLKLAINLLNNVKNIEKDPFPVIFNLASWSDEYSGFEDWLIAMLKSSNGVSRDFALQLLKEKRIIFLLDGLDELERGKEESIANEKRAKCLDALNDFLTHGREVVICCRLKDFLNLRSATGQEAPVSAKVTVLDLTENQVKSALNEIINPVNNLANLSPKEFEKLKNSRTGAANLLNLIKNNSSFLEALKIPFYFTTAIEVFDNQLLKEKGLPNDVESIKYYLLSKFIDRKFKYNLNKDIFKFEKKKVWLFWLAKMMEKHRRINFELTDLQPTNLKRPICFRIVDGFISGVVQGVFFGLFLGMIFGTVIGLVVGIAGGREIGTSVGILFGVLIALITGALHGLIIFSGKSFLFNITVKLESDNGIIHCNEIESEDKSQWYFPIKFSLESIFFDPKSFRPGWISDLTTFLTMFLCFSLAFNLFSGLLLIFCLFWGISVNRYRIIKKFVAVNSPYERLQSGLALRFISCVITYQFFTVLTFSLTQDLEATIIVCFFTSLYGALVALLCSPIFRHMYLRFCLWFEGSTPLKYATFLDYAAEAHILEKDGGFWRFRHQNLQDYFANLKD